jgi:hypothetical protein
MVNHSIYQQKNVFPRPEPVPGFPTLYVMVFIVVSDFEERGGLLISMELLTIMA